VAKIGELYKSADWKTEKHVPVIECPNKVGTDEMFEVKVTIGKEVDHPNTTEHHIRWIQLYFQPEGAQIVYQIGTFEFTAHGESTEGPNTGPVYTHHCATAKMKIKKGGTIYATSFCNIHGLWENSQAVSVG